MPRFLRSSGKASFQGLLFAHLEQFPMVLAVAKMECLELFSGRHFQDILGLNLEGFR